MEQGILIRTYTDASCISNINRGADRLTLRIPKPHSHGYDFGMSGKKVEVAEVIFNIVFNTTRQIITMRAMKLLLVLGTREIRST